MKNMKKYSLYAAGMFLICFLTTSVICSIDFFAYLDEPIDLTVLRKVFFIHPGDSFKTISDNLTREGIVTSPLRFKLAAKYLQIIPRIKSGEYAITNGMSARDILTMFVDGRFIVYKITIQEGKDIYEIADIIAGILDKDREKFIKLAKNFRDDPELKNLEIPKEATDLEGFLFPDTYHFNKNHSLADIISTMVKNFNRRYKDLFTKIESIYFMKKFEIITLASIVEKETGNQKERGMISSVFHNRLRIKMMLQSDPTVIYGVKPYYNGNIQRKDLLTDTPYNTYTRTGLPAGPICNPGILAIRSVLFPDDGEYLYFVSKNDGTHYFSKTYAEHQEAVRKYQLHQ